jgi:serine/threonine-protein kinase RsbW
MRHVDIKSGAYEVQTAVDEACTNIINYAYAGKGGMITITCELHDSDFVVTISDNGKQFDPIKVPPPDLESGLNERKIGGLGIYFMKKLMDDVSYSFDKNGNTLVMRKRIIGQKTGN